MDYRAAKFHIVEMLKQGLSNNLTYHGLRHTRDVLRMTTHIARQESISGRDLVLLKTAAVFHDAGFLNNVHNGHEAAGCELVKNILPQYGYQKTDIDAICSMIMATKIPQSPKNLMEAVLCDADLDYLGRNDFYEIGNRLFGELSSYKLIDNYSAWNNLQVSFLTAHAYHTNTNKQDREPIKQKHLAELLKLTR